MVDSIHESSTADRRTATVPARLGGFLRRPAGAAGLALTLVAIVAAITADAVAPFDPLRTGGPSLAPPSSVHLMGTDALGRDLFSGVIHGARASLVVAAGVGAIAFTIGVAIGSISGYFGGTVDDLLMRATEVVQVVPRFFFALLALALFGTDQTVLVVALGATSWVVLARVVRAEVMSLRSREFVAAARSEGASPLRIVFVEILPNALPVTVVYVALLLAHVILLEASLGFLGLGDPNVVSWGYLAGQAQSFLRVAWWLPLFPGLAITSTVLGLNLLGDAITDVLGRR